MTISEYSSFGLTAFPALHRQRLLAFVREI